MKKLWIKTNLATLLFLLTAGFVVAATVYTYTPVNFNIESVTSFSLELLGDINYTSGASPGTQTATIEFNTTSVTQADVDPCVTGGSCQSNGNPIFKYWNVGTTNITIEVYLSADLPSCMNLQGGTTYPGTTEINSTTNVTVNANLGTATSQDWYMNVDFTSCNSGDSTSRNITSVGNTVV